MGMDFPSPASLGQIYAPTGGPIYRFDGEIWTTMEGALPVIVTGTIGRVSPFDFGGMGDGLADDGPAIQKAIDYLYTTYRGGTVDMSGGRWLVNSGNINMRMGVFLVGSWKNSGETKNFEVARHDWSSFKSTIVLNPAFTIMHEDDSCGVEGLLILCKNLITPTDIRSALDIVSAYSGKGINIGNEINGQGGDVSVKNCLILGFEYGIYSYFAHRCRFENVQGDCTNGIFIKDCHDKQHLSHCHFWPFVTTSWGPVSYAVSSAIDNGSGLVRLIFTNPTPMITGDIVNVLSVGGVTGATGRRIVTVIDSTTVDLQETTFGGAHTSGGVAYLNGHRRLGKAYWFDDGVDWAQADNCFAFNYDIGFNVFSSDCTLINIGTDGWTQLDDQTTIGINLKDCAQARLIGCQNSSYGKGVVVDVGTGNLASIVSHNAVSIRNTGISILSGYVTIHTSHFDGMPFGIVVATTGTVDGTNLMGNRMNGVTSPIVMGGTEARKSVVFGNSWIETTIGRRLMTEGGSNRNFHWTDFSDSASASTFVFNKARGTAAAPTVALLGDQSVQLQGTYWDGVSAFRNAGMYRIVANEVISPTSAAGMHLWSCTQPGTVDPDDVLALRYGTFYPVGDLSMNLGAMSARWINMFGDKLTITDGTTAPATIAGGAVIYVDSADNNLKVKFSNGVVKVIATNP